MNDGEDFNKIDKNFEYIFFTRAFLLLAYSGIENKQINLAEEREELVPDFAKQYILAPVFFNIKHAIELFIKSVSKIFELTDKDFEKKHDINFLFLKIRGLLDKNKKIKEEDINKLEKLILKYHHLEFLNKKIKNNFIITDKENDVFRYPDNKAGFVLNFENIFYQFKESDIEEIKHDIKQLHKLFYDIGAKILGINEEIENPKMEIIEEIKKYE